MKPSPRRSGSDPWQCCNGVTRFAGPRHQNVVIRNDLFRGQLRLSGSGNGWCAGFLRRSFARPGRAGTQHHHQFFNRGRLIAAVNRRGFGGQPVIEECVPKIQQAAAWRTELGLSFRIEVDGGINNETAVECARAGADTFVAGTALFRHRNLRAAVDKMRALAAKAGSDLL